MVLIENRPSDLPGEMPGQGEVDSNCVARENFVGDFFHACLSPRIDNECSRKAKPQDRTFQKFTLEGSSEISEDVLCNQDDEHLEQC